MISINEIPDGVFFWGSNNKMQLKLSLWKKKVSSCFPHTCNILTKRRKFGDVPNIKVALWGGEEFLLEISSEWEGGKVGWTTFPARGNLKCRLCKGRKRQIPLHPVCSSSSQTRHQVHSSPLLRDRHHGLSRYGLSPCFAVVVVVVVMLLEQPPPEVCLCSMHE